MIQSGGSGVVGWYQDYDGIMFSDPGNQGSGGKYWVGAQEPSDGRFEWAGGISTLAAFNSTQVEEGGRYLTTAERDAALKAAGIPLKP